MIAGSKRDLPGGLKHADPAEFGATRRKCGKGWSYHDAATGKRLRDERTGQATAIHWRARDLDGRTAVAESDRLMALLVRILDRYHLRVGSRLDATRNNTFGLTTLRKKHLKERDTDLVFDYISKGGKRREVAVTDPWLISLVREVAEFPGWELFSIDSGGEKITADAQRINDYIRRISGEDFTARTFRTWAGTVLCVKHIEPSRWEVRENPQRKLSAALTERVAERLGNTPAICRRYYMHPEVLEAVLQEGFDPAPGNRALPGLSLYRVHECRTMEILNGCQR